MKQNKFTVKINGIVLFIAATILVVATVFITYKFADKMYYSNTEVNDSKSVVFDGEETKQEKIDKFNELIEYIRENYYFSIDENDLIEGAIKGMVEALNDGESEYILPGELEAYLLKIQGKDENGEYIKTVESADLGDRVKYIKITYFTENTKEEFKTALTELLMSGTRGLIIDLRDNQGGDESSATAIADIVSPEGTIATVRDKNGEIVKTIVSGENAVNTAVTVLINENTKTTAEMLAGAIKELGNAKLIGVQTQGNGKVQKITENNDGSGLCLAVWEYFTTEGNHIEGVGITPDYVVENISGQEDLQLAKAIELLKE